MASNYRLAKIHITERHGDKKEFPGRFKMAQHGKRLVRIPERSVLSDELRVCESCK